MNAQRGGPEAAVELAGSHDDLIAALRRSGAFGDRLAGSDSDPGGVAVGERVERLWRGGSVTAGDLADAVAAVHRLPRASFGDVAASPAILGQLSRRFLRDAAAFPHEGPDGEATLAVADPERSEAISAIALALGRPVALVVLSFEEIELLFEQASAEAPPTAGLAAAPDGDGSDAVEALQDLARGAPIVRAIDQLLERAIESGATDIHIETGREDLRVRLRVDGRLRIEQIHPRHLAAAMISRVKIIAGLDIAERRLPQDGRANVVVAGVEADLRVAIMPTMYGETAVLRILLKDSKLLDFARVGVGERDRLALEALLREPHGILIVTGPTGSGKTTTLAASMSVLNDPARKIVTVEDPIEYQIPGVHQTQIKPSIGLTFATALRSFLRHDPDVIMVGEMRDRETAAVGAQAALTGHLVLTTLHTNTAVDAVIRLADMGVEPYLVASALRGVVGQRLVRRLCGRCKRREPSHDAEALQFAADRDLKRPERFAFHAAKGCPACGGTGYRGRIGVFEVMRVDEELRSLIRERPNPQLLLDAARRGGMTTMLEDGFGKAAQGLTTIEEVLRATG